VNTQFCTAIAGTAATITLTRPRALHALSGAMCTGIAEALLGWRDNPAIAQIIIEHEPGTRGFCAGGDIAGVRVSASADGGAAGRAIFMAEYRLNHLLFTYPKPVITFMDGVTMGGGAGLSLPAAYRIATNNTVFAMPEGAIGLFPDIGAGWYLPHLPGNLGKFLALTGARLDGAECFWAGLATHYLTDDRLDEVKAALRAGTDTPAGVLAGIACDPPEPRLKGNAETIARLFTAQSLEDIIADLAADPGDWAAKELRAVTAKCPTSSKVALRLFATAPQVPDFAAEMTREYAIAARMLMRPDFAEGVRAVLLDKDNAPRWQPATPAEVTDSMLDAIFAPLPRDEAWTPLAS